MPRTAGRLLVVVLLLIGLAVLVHTAGAGGHGMSMVGTCLAVLQTALLGFVVAPVVVGRAAAAAARPPAAASFRAPVPPGRHPPDEGVVLRH